MDGIIIKFKNDINDRITSVVQEINNNEIERQNKMESQIDLANKSLHDKITENEKSMEIKMEKSFNEIRKENKINCENIISVSVNNESSKLERKLTTKFNSKIAELKTELEETLNNLKVNVTGTKIGESEEAIQKFNEIAKDSMEKEQHMKFDDDTKVQLYAKYMTLNKELQEYKEEIVNGYKGSENELLKKTTNYESRISALEEILKNLDSHTVNVPSKQKTIGKQSNKRHSLMLKDSFHNRELDDIPEQSMKSEETKKASSSRQIIDDEPKFDLTSTDMNIELLIKAVTSIRNSMVSKTTLINVQQATETHLSKLADEIKDVKTSLNDVLNSYKNLDLDHKTIKDNFSKLKSKVFH